VSGTARADVDPSEGRNGAVRGAILVCGTGSDAGKSLLAAGICRWLARSGVRVAPFKAQNMALNSVVTADGREVARSQAVQAQAAGVELEAAMNPILLKPSGPHRSQLIALGRPRGELDARAYQQRKAELRPLVLEALAGLRRRFEVIVCEGAGSPAEINLRDADLVNMGLARAAALPVIIVADIERGGVFASLLGTLALLHPADQAHVAGFVINRFRGQLEILRPGLEQLERLTGRPVLGVLPYREGLWLDAEDSLALDAQPGAVDGLAAPSMPSRPEARARPLEVAVVRLRYISNFTDADALRAEPHVRVGFTTSAADVHRADLVILPGTKATVADLERLRASGLAEALQRRAAAGAPLLGICGGYQMLGEAIEDQVESGRGAMAGLGLLPVRTRFAEAKLLRRRRGCCPWLQTGAEGYEIRHGRLQRRTGAEPLLIADDGEPEGCRAGAVLGLSWHGALEHDGFRRALLAWVGRQRGLEFTPGEHSFAALREARLDALGELVARHLDTERLRRLIEAGAPTGLPAIRMHLEPEPCCAF
jgi:adenosylcobyric acid synthase